MLKYFRLFAKKEGDSKELTFQKMLIFIIALILLALSIIWGAIYVWIYGWNIIAFAAFLYTLIDSTAMIISHRLKNHYILVHTLLAITFALPATIQFAIGSLANSGMVINWLFLGALGSLIFTTLRQSFYWMTGFIIVAVFTIYYEPAIYGEILETSPFHVKLQYNMNIIASFTLFYIASAWFVKSFKTEKERSDSLLLNILPKDVAEELKEHGRVEPISHPNATVLFTDFKGFTEISGSISAKELVAEINYCFQAFDEITSKYHIEKIKTIGDSYMAVGADFGGEDCTPWHVVSAGIEMQEFIRKRKIERDKAGKFAFEMRVGVHTGPIISGVVGVKKFQFDIWGDTVNVASRMETKSEIGQVNISGYTHDLVKDDFDFEFRGVFPVKGKKDMHMYFVKLKEKASA